VGAAASLMRVHLLYAIVIEGERVEVAKTLVSSAKDRSTWGVTQRVVDGFERGRLGGHCHFLAFQAVVELLRLLVFAGFLAEGGCEVLVVGF